jgi:hypothetical protein
VILQLLLQVWQLLQQRTLWQLGMGLMSSRQMCSKDWLKQQSLVLTMLQLMVVLG